MTGLTIPACGAIIAHALDESLNENAGYTLLLNISVWPIDQAAAPTGYGVCKCVYALFFLPRFVFLILHSNVKAGSQATSDQKLQACISRIGCSGLNRLVFVLWNGTRAANYLRIREIEKPKALYWAWCSIFNSNSISSSIDVVPITCNYVVEYLPKLE